MHILVKHFTGLWWINYKPKRVAVCSLSNICFFLDGCLLVVCVFNAKARVSFLHNVTDSLCKSCKLYFCVLRKKAVMLLKYETVSCSEFKSCLSRRTRFIEIPHLLPENHFEENEVRNAYKYRVIRNGCRGFNNLPPRSPDATTCDFFLWGYVKDQVYVPPLPGSIPELKVSEPPLKTSPLTCYRQLGTNSIIVLMFVESQTVHI